MTRLRTLSLLLAVAVVQLASTPCFAAKPKPKAAKPAAPAAAPAPPAPAAPLPGPKPLSESLSDEAKSDYESGKLLYGDGDYAGARVKFQAAYELSKDPRLLWNAAACEKGLRHYAKVVTLVKHYLESGSELISSEDRRDAQDLLSAIDSFTVGLTITVNEPDAQVFIDGESVGASPLPGPVTVDIGTRQIELKKPGFLSFSQAVPVGGSKDALVNVTLLPEVHEGELSVNAPRGASITIDGKSVASGHFSGKLGSGGHTLRVEAPGMRPYQSEIIVQDNEKRGIDVVLEPVASAVPAGPTPEPEGALHGLELGVRAGYGSQTNRVEVNNSNGTNNNQTLKISSIPIGIDIGYRLGRPTYLGIFGEYGPLDRSGTCGILRHGPHQESPGDLAVRYGYTSCSGVKAGVVLAFHVLPRTIIDPYFGFEIAAHGTFARYRGFDPTTGLTFTGNDNNGSFQPGLQLGLDSHPFRGLSAGFLAVLGPSFGGEGQPKNDNNNNSGSSCQPINGMSTCSSQTYGTNSGAHFVFGLRVAYTFQ